jgi:RNA polymerase sigma factor (sigma-70 family)
VRDALSDTIHQVDKLVRKWARYASRRYDLDAEDFAQEALLQLWKNRSPSTALVIKQTAIDLLATRHFYRQGHHTRSFEWPEVSMGTLSDLSWAVDTTAGPEEEVRKRERLEHVARCLSEREMCIVVCLLNGRAARDIADALGLMEPRVSQIRSDIIKKLENLS